MSLKNHDYRSICMVGFIECNNLGVLRHSGCILSIPAANLFIHKTCNLGTSDTRYLSTVQNLPPPPPSVKRTKTERNTRMIGSVSGRSRVQVLTQTQAILIQIFRAFPQPPKAILSPPKSYGFPRSLQSILILSL